MLDKEQIEKIKVYYKPSLSRWNIGMEKGKVRGLMIGSKELIFQDYESKIIDDETEKKVFLTFGSNAANEEEAIEAGCIVTTDIEIAEAFAPKEFAEKQGTSIADKLSRDYLKKEKEKIGLIHIAHGWDGVPHETAEMASGWVNASEIEIGIVSEGKYKGKYIAEFSMQTAIDDYDITSMIFENKPTWDTVLEAHTLEDAYFALLFNKLKPVFHCWECGLLCHWTKIPGSFEEKIEHWKDNYCGC